MTPSLIHGFRFFGRNTIARGVRLHLMIAVMGCVMSVVFSDLAQAQRRRGRGRSALPQPQATTNTDLEKWIEAYTQRLPASAADCTEDRAALCAEAARAIDLHAAAVAEVPEEATPEASVTYARRLMMAGSKISELADRTLAIRTQFIEQPEGEARHQQLLAFLKMTNGVFDLAGRMSFYIQSGTYESAFRVAARPDIRATLIAAVEESNNAIGAEVMCWAMIDPPPGSVNGAQPADLATKSKLIKLAAESGHLGTLPILAQFVRVPNQSAQLVVQAADAIRTLGLPQDPRPGEEEGIPAEITAAELQSLLSRINGSALDEAHNAKRKELIAWLDDRISRGVTAEEFSLGSFSVRPGDWLLMRNPSPYNLFTDLSPGLFTHVGIVTTETGTDGRRRFVIVDLPERGTHIPATNVESFVKRTRHYVFVRPQDAAAAETIAGVAREIIGNESVFDLKFRTAGVTGLKGQPKAGQKIETYCAGLLLLAAQETSLAREEFFPIAETMAPGKTAENLGGIGLSFGDNFISPTGSLFSPALAIVGRRAPGYEPSREIEEAIYDHFAASLRTRTLRPQESMFQNLRTTLAEAATTNPALARMLAQLNDVNPDMDLQAAAKTAAVVEALDDAAYGASGDYMDAIFAVTAPSAQVLQQRGVPRADIEEIESARRSHRDLAQRYAADEVNNRQLREALVAYYVEQGKAKIDAMFTD